MPVQKYRISRREEVKHCQSEGESWLEKSPQLWMPGGSVPRPSNGSDRALKASGRAGAGAGWGRRRLGAGSRTSYADAPVPARPPSYGLAAVCAERGSGEENQQEQTPGEASTPLGAAILSAGVGLEA